MEKPNEEDSLAPDPSKDVHYHNGLYPDNENHLTLYADQDKEMPALIVRKDGKIYTPEGLRDLEKVSEELEKAKKEIGEINKKLNKITGATGFVGSWHSYKFPEKMNPRTSNEEIIKKIEEYASNNEPVKGHAFVYSIRWVDWVDDMNGIYATLMVTFIIQGSL